MEEPLGTDSHWTISKQSSEWWLLIGHKKCFVLLCPISKQFLLSSFREFVHDSYYLATGARFVHQGFPNPKRRNYWWVEKCCRCHQQEQFNLHWENSVSDGSQCIINNRKFKMQRPRESLTRQNDNFARASCFFVHFFAVTAQLPLKNA